jgi:lactoylglutathione lyase
MPGFFRSMTFAIAIPVVAVVGLQPSRAADAKSEFARETIDLGIVATDVAKSVKFYTDALGFSETAGFSVPADFCADAGLTDKQALKIRVLVLGDGPTATKLKLMEVPGVKVKQTDNGFIHSQLGYRYLTIYVADASAALARLQKAGAKPLAKGPVPLPAGLPAGMTLTVVRDPDGNLIELVGPKR